MKNEKRQRILTAIIAALSITVCLFHIYTAGFGLLTAIKQRITHWGLIGALALVLCVQDNPMKSVKDKIFAVIDTLLAAGNIAAMLYVLLNYTSLITRAGRLNSVDLVFGCIIVVTVLWATYRRLGPAIVIVALVSLAYAYWGNLIPGGLGHKGFSVTRIINQLAFSTEGVLGAPLGASASFVILFVIFAAMLDRTGAGQFFINLTLAGTGKTRGGPAKAAVLGSALFGTISGSAVANVVGTGTFTIPLMKRTGVEPQYAAAVEAVASTGGQFVPPVMGAGAFIMAEVTGTPYMEVMKAAIIPAILYYVALYFCIDLHSAKLNLTGIPASELPNVKEEIRRCGHMILPLALLVYTLVSGFTALRAGFIGMVSVIVMSFFRKNTRIGFRSFFEGLISAARGAVEVACACACAGIIMGMMSLTGLGLKLSALIVAYASGRLIIALILTMLCSLVLGMGLPTVACYLMLAILVAPALVDMGVPVLAAHLFIFYFGIISTITPPVALAAYAAAGLAKSDPFKTGWTAFRLGITAFIVPYAFVYGNELMLIGTPVKIILACITAGLGVYFVASAMEGWYCKRSIGMPARIALFAAAITLLIPGVLTDVIGLAIAAAVFLLCKLMHRNMNNSVPE